MNSFIVRHGVRSAEIASYPVACNIEAQLWGVYVEGDMIHKDAGNVSPSPRFAESAEQNGERAGVRCFVLILGLF
jgi:hypothetical protein